MGFKKVIADYLGKLSELVSGDTIEPSQLGTGTADSTKFLRGDGTWQVPAGGGGLDEAQFYSKLIGYTNREIYY